MGNMNCIGKNSKSNSLRKQFMKICCSFRCNSYGPWTPTKCDSILIFTSFYNKVCHDIICFNTKMSYLSDFKRTKSKDTKNNQQTDDELNKAAMWSSANDSNKRLIFLKFDYHKYSNNLLLLQIYICHLLLKCHKERLSSHWHPQLHTRLAEPYKWCCADLHTGDTMLSWMHSGLQHI